MKNLILATLVITASVAVFGQDKKSKKVKPDPGIYAEIQTDKGNIVLKLADKEAPLTVANFVGLAEGSLTVFDTIKHNKPYYDGVKFHRVIANFMIQGGDPTGTGSGGPGYKFFDEANNGLIHDGPGILSMANAGPATNGSQFFITHVPTPHLNGKHTVFGRVLEGQDVVDRIQQGDVMKTIKITRVGKEYKKYNPTKIFADEYNKLESAVRLEQERKAKLKAMNDVRLVEAQAKSIPEYKDYFYEMIKHDHPTAQQTESGLVYVILQDGTGPNPKSGDGVSLHYNGVFVYGDKFDSSIDRGMPLNFDYLIMGLIPGFNEGVGLSKQGMKINLFIPYYIAYGDAGRRPTIPPYSDLIFELEILEINAK
jgi:peptidyl-prolyl cis-trans isomerase A (cyclophilin A)